MPARVHAILVVRPDGRTPAAFHLRRTLAALAGQTRPVDVLTIVLCGEDAGVTEVAAASDAESVVTAPASTGFAAAIALVTPRLDGDAVWILAQDTAPEPEALNRLAGSLELAPSVAFVAPKLVRWDDRSEIVSLGVSMTAFGRTVGIADGELDQGQHDGREDVLGHGRARHPRPRRRLARARRPRSGAARRRRRPRPRRARTAVRTRASRSCRRRSSPTAGDGVAGPPSPLVAAAATAPGVRVARRRSCTAASSTRRSSTVPLHWLSLLPLALWRSLVAPRPQGARPHRAGVGGGGRRRRPARRRSAARAGGSRRRDGCRGRSSRHCAPRGRQLRESLDDEPERAAPGYIRRDLRFFAGRWRVARARGARRLGRGLSRAAGLARARRRRAAAAAHDGGCSCGRMPGTGSAPWGSTRSAPPIRSPRSSPLLGSLAPWEPSRAIVVLWVLALPLAALGGWFAATRVTERSGLRLTGGLVWALAPTLLVALTQGRPAAVIAHLLLPWLFYAGSVAHRSWAAAGAASLLLAAVVASAPALAPALAAIWAGAIVLALVLRAGRGVARLIWTAIPAVALAAPLVWYADSRRRGVGAGGGPGRALGGSAGGRGCRGPGPPRGRHPDSRPRGVDGAAARGTHLVGAAAVRAAGAARSRGTAHAALGGRNRDAGRSPGSASRRPSPRWASRCPSRSRPPCRSGRGRVSASRGSARSAGALVTLDAGLAPRLRLGRALAALAVCAAIAVLAFPALTSMARGVAFLTNGPISTLPAYVAAAGRESADVGTIVLTPQNAEGLSSRIVWGGSETLGGQSTIVSTAHRRDAAGRRSSPSSRPTWSRSSAEDVDRAARRMAASASCCSRRRRHRSRTAARTMRLVGVDGAGSARHARCRRRHREGHAVAGHDRGHRTARRCPTTCSRARPAHRGGAARRRRRSRCCSRSRRRPRDERPGAPRASSAALEGGPMSDRRVFRWATTSARLLAATIASVAAVVAVVTAVSVPWPTITREPVSVSATPAPAATVIVCDGGLLTLGSRSSRTRRRSPSRRPQTITSGVSDGRRAAGGDACSTSPSLSGGEGPAVFTAQPQGRTRTDVAASGAATVVADDIAGFAASACRPPLHGVLAVGGSGATGAADIVRAVQSGRRARDRAADRLTASRARQTPARRSGSSSCRRARSGSSRSRVSCSGRPHP